MNTLFISYASTDQAVAMEVCALLEAQGVACWIAPRDVSPGAVWDEAILDAIGASGAFLLVLTAGANESPYVKNELNHAFAAKKPIFTFRVEDVQPSKSLSFYLARHHWTDGFTGPLPETVPQVAAAVTALLGAQPGVAAVAPPRTSRPAPKPRTRRLPLVPLAAGLLAGILVAAPAVWTLKPAPEPSPSQVMRFTIRMPDGFQLLINEQLDPPSSVTISPDGKFLAYSAQGNGVQQIYIRPIDDDQSTPVAGSLGAAAPIFSPDSQWIGFFSAAGFDKAPTRGGNALHVDSLATTGGVFWGSDRMITVGGANGLRQLPEGGGSFQQLTQPVPGVGNHRTPFVLPGNRGILFSATGGPNFTGPVLVREQATGTVREVVPLGVAPRYTPTGHLVFVQGGALLAAGFDLETLAVTSEPQQVLQGILQMSNGLPYYSLSETGTLVYVSGNATTARRLVWVSRRGIEEPLPAPTRGYDWPRLSPDGRRIAVEIDQQVWTYDLARDTLTRLTFTGASNDAPAWTPDGSRIVVRSNREGPPNRLFWQSADGSGGDQRLTDAVGVADLAQSFSPDGRFLAFIRADPKTLRDIWILSMQDRKRTPFLVTQTTEGAARFSPDGRWIAYVSGESGRPEIYVQPFPGPGGKWQISTDGGIEPLWNPNGRELFYRSGRRMMAVPVTTQGTFSADRPVLIFEGDYLASTFPLTGVTYDITRDGQRFLMVKDETTSATQINVIADWFEELKRLVPTE